MEDRERKREQNLIWTERDRETDKPERKFRWCYSNQNSYVVCVSIISCIAHSSTGAWGHAPPPPSPLWKIAAYIESFAGILCCKIVLRNICGFNIHKYLMCLILRPAADKFSRFYFRKCRLPKINPPRTFRVYIQ